MAALVLLAAHLGGLAVLLRLMQLPLWWAVVPLLPFIFAQFSSRLRPVLSPLALAPLFLLYGALGVRYVWIRILGGDVPGYFEYTLPDPRVLLHFELLAASAALYALLILTAFFRHSRTRAILAACVMLGGAVLGWAASEYFGHRTAGATGSDPYAYVQMGIDLAGQGEPAHRFAWFPRVISRGIAWYPVLHVGYRQPFNASGDAITVWAPGGSLAYAAAYRMGGESALYLVNPLVTFAGVLVTGLLAWELARGESTTRRTVAALGSAALLATSNEIVNWAGVTMVDAQALVWSAAAVYCALRVYRSGSAWWAVAAGALWGLAYAVRHTQLVIAVAFLPLFLLARVPARRKIVNAAWCGMTALVAAAPDLWYHQIYLGSWLVPESEELALFALDAIPRSLGGLGQSAMVGAEFGWLALWLIVGSVWYARFAPVPSTALVLWLAAALAVHLPYAALRLRDLIPQFPILAFYVSVGGAAAIGALWKRDTAWAQLFAAVLVLLTLELGLVRVWNTIPRAVLRAPARFGAMTDAQRESFRTLAALTPSNALVGSSLNSGAVELYARRTSFRPADWSEQDLSAFFRLAREDAVEIYLLEDNASMQSVMKSIAGDYDLERTATLDVPLFGAAPVPNPGALWKLVRKN